MILRCELLLLLYLGGWGGGGGGGGGLLAICHLNMWVKPIWGVLNIIFPNFSGYSHCCFVLVIIYAQYI